MFALFIFGMLILVGSVIVFIIGQAVSQSTSKVQQHGGLAKTGAIVAALIGFFLVVISTMTYVSESEVGVVVKTLGGKLPPGQIIARNGESGTQADILGPGWHFWYWPWAYKINSVPVTDIPAGMVGIIDTNDGKPLDPGEAYAPEWTNTEDMLDAKKFLESGYKGSQLTVLRNGQYRLNPSLYKVSIVPALDIPIGQVGVVKANAGRIPTEKDIVEVVNGVPIVAKGCRGIWKDPYLPGLYYIHPKAYEITKVSTSNRVYEYAEFADKDMSDPILVRSSDGFTFPVDVRCGVNVDAADAPHVAAVLGKPDDMVMDGEDKGKICILEARCVLPAIRTLLRNIAEKQTAFQFVDQRSEVEKQTTEEFILKMRDFRIKAEGCFIGQIDFDHNPQVKALMQTRTDKEVAVNQQKMYVEQEKAQQQRVNLTKAEEQANQQKNLVAAQFEVEVQKQKAMARAAEAEGESKYIEITFAARQKAYEQLAASIGKENVTLLEILKVVKEGNIKITPDVMVTGGGVMDALAGTIIRQNTAAAAAGAPATK